MDKRKLLSESSIACSRISGFLIGIALFFLIMRLCNNLGFVIYINPLLLLISLIICGIIGAKIGTLVSRKVKWISFITLPLAFPILFVSLLSMAPFPGGPAYGIYGSGDIEGNRLVIEYQICRHKGAITELRIRWNVPESLSVVEGVTNYRGGRLPFSKRKFVIIFEKTNDVKWDEIKLTGEVDLILSGNKIHRTISWDKWSGFSRVCEEL